MSDRTATAPASRPGVHADSPAAVPPSGWLEVSKRVFRNLGRHRTLSLSAAMTFYSLLAIFPAIAAIVSLVGLFSDASKIGAAVQSLSSVLPGGAIQVVGDQVRALTQAGSKSLGLSFVVSLVIALWSANSGIKAIFDALNVVNEEEEKRNFFLLNAITLGITVASILFVVIASAAMVAVPTALNVGGFGAVLGWVLWAGRWPALLIIVALFLSILYRFGPSRNAPKWRWVTPGSALASLCWLVASMLFSWYVANFGSYNKTYGSLGAVIGFMTWMWISGIVILLGAELNAQLELQTSRDTTTGAPKPMGERRAEVADKVA